MKKHKRVHQERKFWEKFAPKYDRFVDRRIGSYPLLLEKVAEEVQSGATVIEVATGTGLLALKVAEKAAQVHGVDISPAMIEEAKKKASEGQVENVFFSVEDAYALPFEEGRFDMAICSNALHNMQVPQTALDEMKRVLKPEGKLLTPMFCHGENLKSKIVSHIMALTGFPAYHRFTISGFIDLLKGCGFTILKNEVIEDTIPVAFPISKAPSKENQ